MWLFPLRQGKVMKVIDNWAYISSLAIILLAYYPVYCPSFPRQRGLDSETCLDGLIAFLHSLRSWAKEVDSKSIVYYPIAYKFLVPCFHYLYDLHFPTLYLYRQHGYPQKLIYTLVGFFKLFHLGSLKAYSVEFWNLIFL